jgi:hypothetical protein
VRSVAEHADAGADLAQLVAHDVDAGGQYRRPGAGARR